MHVDRVYARFFRSLNYDYLRKTASGYRPDPWDATSGGAQYPFVRITLEPDVTAIVGANESGKSQFLAAIEGALIGEGIEPRDFCRYSSFFSDPDLVLPEFGARFAGLGERERKLAAEMCDTEVPDDVTTAAVFRMNNTPKLRLYLRSDGGEWSEHRIKKPADLRAFGVPDVFEIDSSVPLPDAVSLEFLASGALSAQDTPAARRRIVEELLSTGSVWLSSAASIRENADAIAATLDGAATDEHALRQHELAADLLLKVAGLSRELFVELRDAVADGAAGYAGSIVDTVNEKLGKRLNLPHWWSQDSMFDLRVELRDRTLAFVITDRTGSTYSFDERSEGLKYFLSYYVQYLSHEAPQDGQPEILLMDEPDAYLSASGQQDLLRIFEAFAHPEDEAQIPIQVVYVTHSPFLIDKNHAERVRVLEKGEHDEGTRVVANASRNHYEPLRSAFGSFVGETTFMGTCNLVIEGPSDQIILAGLSSWLAGRGTPNSQRLDLNTLTLVPAGGASHVPYIAYLARGRDVDRPAVVVLLDGDDEGDLAAKELARGGPRGNQLVRPELVLQLSALSAGALHIDNPAGCRTIEDLVPFDLLVEAAKRYCHELVPEADVGEFAPTAADAFTDGADTHGALQAALRSYLERTDLELNKIGLARSIVAVVKEVDAADTLQLVEGNFRQLFGELSRRQRLAEREQGTERISSRINRIKRTFFANHPSGARREEAVLLVEEVEDQLDSSLEADAVRLVVRGWVRDFGLDEDLERPIEDWEGFQTELDGLAYAGTQVVQQPSLS
jgi:energy-coupling factor transporter ATP-binding protein EcfA2